MVRALDWGSRDREFKSPRPDEWISAFVALATSPRTQRTVGDASHTPDVGSADKPCRCDDLIVNAKGIVVAEVEEWLAQAGEALDVSVADVLPKDLRREMLDLTGDIAHNVVRVAVPWTSYLMGVAVGRGASPQEAMRIVRELLPPPADDEQ